MDSLGIIICSHFSSNERNDIKIFLAGLRIKRQREGKDNETHDSLFETNSFRVI